MQRISELEKKYVLEALDYQFATSTNSVFTSRLEKAFSSKFNSKYSINCANGTATLHTALVACGIKEGDEVIVPPLTMSSPAISVLQAGATPIFADVDPKTFIISPDGIRKVITKKTRAIMTVSLYGLSPEYEEIKEICKEHDLYLIEDNAECFLGKYKGKYVGEFGDFSSYSFQATKHMTSGEGGMLTTNDGALADAARKFTSLGYAGVSSSQGKITKSDIQDPNYIRHVTLGFNYRMSEVCSAVALGQLERLEELVDARVQTAKVYDEVFDKFGDVFTKQSAPEYMENSYWAYSVYLNERFPKEDWYRFKEIYKEHQGQGFYAAWKLSYQETLLKKFAETGKTWQNYDESICPIAEFLQPRILQFKTDFWNIEDAKLEASIIEKTIREFLL